MWPGIMYETCDWDRTEDDLLLIPKSRRRKITATYEAALPPAIAGLSVDIPSDVSLRAAEAGIALARFDQAQEARGYNLPALLLRSESSSSSHIERLTSSARNVAMAELTDKVPGNAKLIAANVAAMRTAIRRQGAMDAEFVCEVHDELMRGTGEALGFRKEQVWIGGSPYSPHGALFVPPHASRVGQCLADALRFAQRDDVPPIVKAALFHAQFETIHPFTDGNGRTGRALLHCMLARDGVLRQSALPISAGLLHDVDSYMKALDAYHGGDIGPIIDQLLSAVEIAVVVGSRIASRMDAVLARWHEVAVERKGSAAHRLPELLVEHPVVNAAFVSAKLGITDRAARTVLEAACERGVVEAIGNAKRGVFYQAPELIEVIEEASNMPGIRRLAAG